MTHYEYDPKQGDDAKESALRSFVRRRSVNTDTLELGLEQQQVPPIEKQSYGDVEGLWNSLEAIRDHPDMLQMRKEAINASMRRKFWLRSLVAASVVGALTASLGWWYQSSFSSGWDHPADIQIATGHERGQPVVLDDGSIITVDANSSVVVSMDNRHRIVKVEAGRAYFDVSRDPKRPFTVIADGRTIKALGTEFAVDTLNGRFEVVLVEGRVRVEGRPRERHTSIEMQSGSKLSVSEGKWQATRIDVNKAKNWVEGRLEFDNAPLSDVVNEMNRYAEHKIKISDDGTGEKTISMIVNTTNKNDFLEAVKILNLAKVQKKSDGSIFLHQ